MSSTWVVNASPLILLAKAEHEWLLPELAPRLVIPKVVVAEISQRAEGAQAVQGLLDQPQCRFG